MTKRVRVAFRHVQNHAGRPTVPRYQPYKPLSYSVTLCLWELKQRKLPTVDCIASSSLLWLPPLISSTEEK
jgi:hypothetical protein